jgi:Carbohydrate family 9 binding domain-like/Domain of unknown function (DUF5916)
VCSRWLSLLAAAAAGIASAQAPPSTQGPLQDPGIKTVHMVRTSTPPRIDGKLDDAVWQTAALVDDLHQVSPIEYAQPDERTEIFLLYDDEALYVGAKLYDNMPQDITANILRQNDNMGQDDRFYITIDPFNNKRSGYFFGINPNGVRSDGLYQNVTEFYGAWDTVFFAEAGRFEQGWIAEFKIPFKSISFNPNTDTWGLNFSRGVVRKNENIAWVSRNRAYNPSISGLAIGFTGLDPHGLDVVPSGTLRQTKVFATGETKTSFEPSLDLVYKLTPTLNGSLTINTDFSATEVDDRQVNLTRFSLFFPEKRKFFLREADIFEFGRIGAQADLISVEESTRQNGRPFFSRRIGLNNVGEPVDLSYGAKVSGRVGRWDLGALSIRQDASGAVQADTLSVVRAKVGLFGESTLGFVVTNGDPRTNLDNSLVGTDFQYRNTRLPGGRSLEAEAWYQQTSTEGQSGDDAAIGVGIRVPSSAGFRGSFAMKELQRNYNPGLGFVDRRDVDIASFDVGYTKRPPRGSYIQSLFMSLDGERIDQIGGGLQTQVLTLRPFTLTNRTADALMMVYRETRDVLLAPFEISTGVLIPTGDYPYSDLGVRLQTGNHRKFAGTFMLVNGDFYGGTRRNINGELSWRPSGHFRTLVGYNYNDIRLPEGSFETRLVRLGLDWVFSSRLSWVNLIQYDNVSHTAGVNMRLHWVPESGREVFFVVNQGLEDLDGDGTFHSQRTDATAKVSYTFRF